MGLLPKTLKPTGGRILLEGDDLLTKTPGQMRRMHETGFRTTLLDVPGAGHLVHDDAPEEYRHAVLAFLSTFPGGA